MKTPLDNYKLDVLETRMTTTSSTTDVLPKRRRRLQFTLRTGLVLVAIGALPLAWWGKWFRQIYSPRFELSNRVIQLGGIWFQNNEVVFNRNRVPAQWLAHSLGTVLSDSDLESLVQPLSRLHGLRLDLRGTEITDEGLKHLKSMETLVAVDLQDTKVTDAGVEDLKAALPNVDITR